jgi:hypothetical protein
MPWIMLLPAEDAAPAERWDFWLSLDRDGQPDATAWDATWHARHETPDGALRTGDIVADGAGGWLVRIPPNDDAPPAMRLPPGAGSLHPGAVVTLHRPDGLSRDWRVVAVTFPEA